MKNGAIKKIIEHQKEDKKVLELVTKADNLIKKIQEQIRNGEDIDLSKIEGDL